MIRRVWVLLAALTVLGAVSGCQQAQQQMEFLDPTIEVTGVQLTALTESQATVIVNFLFESQNPLGASLDRLLYEVFFQDGSNWTLLGKVDKSGLIINFRGSTILAIDSAFEGKAAKALYEVPSAGGKTSFRITGSGLVKLGPSPLEIKFNLVKEVPRPGVGALGAPLSRERAIDILKEQVIQPQSLAHNLIAFMLDDPLPQGTEVSPFAPSPLPNGVTTLPYLVPQTLGSAQWFFWVDDAPYAQFAHPTRYVFIDAVSGAVQVTDEAWWPYVDGLEVSRWVAADGRWDEGNWAYSNILEEERSWRETTIPGPSRPGWDVLASSISRYLISLVGWAKAAPAGEAIVPVNGWKPGRGTDAGFSGDMGNMSGFGQNSGIPAYPPQGETLQDIEDAVKNAADTGAKDIFFYWTGHGGRTAAGESFLVFKDMTISPQQLADMLKKFPNVRFKVVVQGCFGGGFVDALRRSGMVDIVLTAANAIESSYGDWDPAGDPNSGDTGSEYSSGLWEDLNEIENSPELQERAKEIAKENGWSEFVAWLTIARESALAKDATFRAGDTHPQSWVSAPLVPPTVAPTPAPAPEPTPAPTPTLEPRELLEVSFAASTESISDQSGCSSTIYRPTKPTSLVGDRGLEPLTSSV